MTEVSGSIFLRYWDRLENADILGDKPTKTTAIRFNQSRPFDGVAAIRNLFNSLDHPGWRNQEQAGQNWQWKNDKQTFKTRSPEVILERTVAFRGNTIKNEWTWQMSTSSGIQKQPRERYNALNKRRAIDLVRNNGNGSFTFVELKVGSDNPLYALFELIGYALAYLHARQNGWHGGDPDNDVFKASEIKLVVLGPERWYQYHLRGKHAERQQFNLKWMLPSLIEGLESIGGGKLTFSISFEKFDDPVNQVADRIIASAPHW